MSSLSYKNVLHKQPNYSLITNKSNYLKKKNFKTTHKQKYSLNNNYIYNSNIHIVSEKMSSSDFTDKLKFFENEDLIGKYNSIENSPINFTNSLKDNNLNFSIKDINNEQKESSSKNNISISIVNPNINIVNNNNTFSLNPLENNTFKQSNFCVEDLNPINSILNNDINKEEEVNKQNISGIFLNNNNGDVNNNFASKEILKKIPTKTKNKYISKFEENLKKVPITLLNEKFDIIEGFSAYSYKNKKPFNENKIGININQEKSNKHINFFSIFSGHCGENAAKYLKDHLNKEIINNKNFISNPVLSIYESFKKIEEDFLNEYLNYPKNKNSKFLTGGSCALILMTINDDIYIINLGDSKAILSKNKSEKIFSLNYVHTPDNLNEIQRIKRNGGEIKNIEENFSSDKQNHIIQNKKRIFPGGLAVSRSLGDVDIKYSRSGNKINIISSVPDIFKMKNEENFDFILLVNEGITSTVNNRELCIIVYETIKRCWLKKKNFEYFLEKVIINLSKNCIYKDCKNNLSIIFIVFNHMKKFFENKNENKLNDIIITLTISNNDFDSIYDELIKCDIKDEINNIRSTNSLGKNDNNYYTLNTELDENKLKHNKKKRHWFFCGCL